MLALAYPNPQIHPRRFFFFFSLFRFILFTWDLLLLCYAVVRARQWQ